MENDLALQLIDQNLKIYNKIAKLFSDTRQYVWEELKPFAEFVNKNDVVVDLGCGNGRLYQIFADLPISYIGIDQSEELLVIARKQFQKGKFVQGSMLSIPLPNNSVDVIFCIAALQHIPGVDFQQKAIDEMKSVLKPGGKVILSNWNLFGEWGLKQVRVGKYKELGNGDFLVPWRDAEGGVLGERYYHGFTIEELVELFASAGFRIEDQYYTKRAERSTKEQGENIITVASLIISQ